MIGSGRELKKMERDVRVGLVLGAGSARGLAHIGVLQALIANQIPFDLIVGSSMGAMIGGFYASGCDLEMLGKMVEHMDLGVFFDVGVPRMGFVAGKKIDNFLQLLTKNKDFNDMKVPIIMVATDLVSGKRVELDSGPVARAIRASISVPGVITPVKEGEMILVDGAVVDRLPLEVARNRGADVIIAVDVTFGEGKEVNIQNTLDIIITSLDIMQKQQFEIICEQADILIQPPVGGYSSRDFQKVRELINIGRRATEARLDEIRTKIDAARESKSKERNSIS